MLRIDNATNTTSDITITKTQNGVDTHSTSTVSIGNEGMKEVSFTQNWGSFAVGSSNGVYEMNFSFNQDEANYKAEVSYATITTALNIQEPAPIPGGQPTYNNINNPTGITQIKEGSFVEVIIF